MRPAVVVLALLAVTFPGAVAAAPPEQVARLALYVDTPDCNAEIERTNKGLQDTMDRLDAARGGSLERKCVAFRNHITFSLQALRVYQRCTLATERAATSAILASSIDEFTGLFSRQCAGMIQARRERDRRDAGGRPTRRCNGRGIA